MSIRKISFALLTLPILAMAFSLSGCITRIQNPQLDLVSEGQYDSMLEDQTKNVKIYDGFTNVMDVTAALLTTKVRMAQTDQDARIYQWTPEKYATERGVTQDELQKEARVFVSFFVPERKQDDLQKTGTSWKIFLDANGHRYEGKSTRIKKIMAEILLRYPFHTRWGTPYMITFPVPMKAVEQGPAVLTFTGPVGSAKLEFPVVQ